MTGGTQTKAEPEPQAEESFVPGPEAEELRGVVRSFLRKRSTPDDVRRLIETDTGFDESVWRQSASELGLQGLIIPERWGGSGASLIELGVVFEEMGRVLFTAPFLGTVGLAVPALLAVGDPAANAEYLPGIAAGETIATLAWGGADPVASTLTAHTDASGWRLSGTAEVVVDAAAADLILALASTGNGPGLFAVGADGADRTSLTGLDTTRKLSALRFDGTRVRAIGVPGQVTAALSAAIDHAVLLLACEQVGGAARVLDMSVEYASTRRQFGRKIGSFQAVKHRCADMLVAVESARSAVYHGIWTAVHEPDELGVAATLAGSLCPAVYTRAALDNIQNHGGIGFTWEHSAHLYLKRAKSTELFLGTPAQHRRRLGIMLGIPEVSV